MIGSLLKPRRVALFIGFVILMILLGTLLIRSVSNKGEDTTSNEVKSVLSSNDMTEYSSPKHNFKITMPGFPSITESSYSYDENNIELTSYKRSINNDKLLYSLEVYDFVPTQLPVDNQKFFETKLNELISQSPNAVMTYKATGSYDNLETLEAAFSSDGSQGDKVLTHIRLLNKNNDLYAIILNGGSDKDFNVFASSLRLSQ